MKRLTQNELHPKVFEAMERYRKTFMYLYGQAGTAERMEAYEKHQSAWWKAYGKQTLWGLLGSLGAVFGSIVWLKTSGLPIALIALLLSLVGSIALGVIAYKRNKLLATPAEIEALLPNLELDETGRTYCETLLAVIRSPFLSELDRTGLIKDLWKLMDEHQRLVGRQSELGGTRTLGEQEYIAAQVKELEAKCEQATDEEARLTYAQALESVKRQLNRINAIKPFLERIDAQSALVLNTLRETREAYSGSESLQSRLTDRQAISTSISTIYAQTDALDKAYAELNA